MGICYSETGVCRMAFKNPFLSRFRSRGQVEKKTEKKSNAQIPLWEQAPEDQAEEKVELPSDHPLRQLWLLYGNQPEQLPPLCFQLPPEEVGKRPPLLADGEAGQELPRLAEMLKARAEFRLNRLSKPDQSHVLDAEVVVFLTSRRVTAWVMVYPPIDGGREVSRAMLENALEEANVSYGVYSELLDSLPNSPDRYFHLFLIAHGQPPVDGEDGHVIDLFSRDPTQALVDQEGGEVDFSSLNLFQKAKKGDVICRIIPPTPCRDGVTVDEEVAFARGGQAVTVPRGRNTEISEDGTCLIAARDGNVEFNGRAFQVKAVMDVAENVDATTGDVNCVGDIHISGDVRSGYSVRATGSITVDGVIEGSVVEAGGDLIVRKGVQGNNQAILRAHRGVFARYLESCCVCVRDDLEAECVINCDVYSNGSVTVRSGRGAIIGGTIRAAKQVSANIIGSRSECQTGINLGGKPFDAFEERGLARELTQLEQRLEEMGRQPDSPEKQQGMSKLRMQISVKKMRLQKFDKELVAEAAGSGDQGRMSCGTAYPGTEIVIGNASLKVTKETFQCTAALSNGQVILIP